MQTVDDTMILLKRQAELESRMKQAGGIRVTEEQELHGVRRRLTEVPEAMKAVIQAAQALRRPVSEVTPSDVECWVGTERL